MEVRSSVCRDGTSLVLFVPILSRSEEVATPEIRSHPSRGDMLVGATVRHAYLLANEAFVSGYEDAHQIYR